MPISLAESLSLRYPLRIPFSIRTVLCVGWPSSSTFSEPRRHGMVPLSTTVHFSLATRLPTSPAKADVCLRLKSASSPWPTASCRSTPGQPDQAQLPFHRPGLRERPVAELPVAQIPWRNIRESYHRRKNPALPDRRRLRCRERNCRLSWRCSPRSSARGAVNPQRRFRRTLQLECCAVRRRSWREPL